MLGLKTCKPEAVSSFQIWMHMLLCAHVVNSASKGYSTSLVKLRTALFQIHLHSLIQYNQTFVYTVFFMYRSFMPKRV